MGERLDNQAFIVRVVVPTLAAVIIVVTLAMMIGLFSPKVNNAEILKIIGPAFLTIVGTFGGFLGGYATGHGAAMAEQAAKDEAPTEP
jgi:hypothetical protein